MTDIRKYVEGKTQAELIEIQRNSVVGGDIYRAVTFEIQRIQQDTNNTQIAKLIAEIQKLKEISSDNSDSSKRFARWSLGIAVVAIFFAAMQTYLAKIQTDPIMAEQYRQQRSLYEFCKEPGNWDPADGGSTPDSDCKTNYLTLRGTFGKYSPAEEMLKSKSVQH